MPARRSKAAKAADSPARWSAITRRLADINERCISLAADPGKYFLVSRKAFFGARACEGVCPIRQHTLKFAEELTRSVSRSRGISLPTTQCSASCTILERLAQRLQQPMRIAIVGETNSGKTSLANALIGQDVLITDLLRNTRANDPGQACRLAHACPHRSRTATAQLVTEKRLKAMQDGSIYSLELGLPRTRLLEFEIIDNPGFSARA